MKTGEYLADDLVADQAGTWDARLRAPGCTDEERARFAAWRDAHPAHQAAFERLQTIVAVLRKEISRADVRSLRDSALTLAHHRRSRRQFVIAASVALLALSAMLFRILPAGAESYATGIGQRYTVTLRDGSTVELNARTRIKVSFNETHRTVELLDGQALFHATENPARPFVVRARDRKITAIGTAFDVQLDATAVRVTLIEGKVSVSPSSSKAPILLTTGQQLIGRLDSKSPSDGSFGRAEVRHSEDDNVVHATDIAKVTAWRDGRIFLEDRTLSDAVAEMNRYSPIQIRVGTSALAGLRINGMFRAGEQQAFIAALEQYFPISAKHAGDKQIILVPR